MGYSLQLPLLTDVHCASKKYLPKTLAIFSQTS